MVYSALAVVLFFFSYILWDKYKVSQAINKKKRNNLAYVVMIIAIICIQGFRWEIGTDWDSYYSYFQTGEDQHAGVGYNFLINTFKSLSDNYTLFLLLIAALTFGITGNVFSKHSINPMMSLCLYFCGSLGIWGCNRQILSMLICLLSLQFIFDRKLILFLLCIVLASTIHITALVFLPAFFLYDKGLSPRLLGIIVLLAFFIGYFRLVNRIPFAQYLAMIDGMTSTTELEGYVGFESQGGSIIGSFKRLLFVFLALVASKRSQDAHYSFFLVLYVVGAVGYLMFNGSVLQMFAGRGMMVYSFFEAIVIPFTIYNLPFDKGAKKVLWAVFFLLSFYLMWRDMNSYVIRYGVDVYNPYKTVLF